MTDKCKTVAVHAIMACRRRGDKAPRSLELGARWTFQHHDLTTLIWKSIPVPIELEAGWHPELAWTFWIREDLLSLPGFKPLEHPACNVVTVLTVLFQFTYLLTIIETARVSFYLFCLQISQLLDIGNGLN